MIKRALKVILATNGQPLKWWCNWHHYKIKKKICCNSIQHRQLHPSIHG